MDSYVSFVHFASPSSHRVSGHHLWEAETNWMWWLVPGPFGKMVASRDFLGFPIWLPRNSRRSLKQRFCHLWCDAVSACRLWQIDVNFVRCGALWSVTFLEEDGKWNFREILTMEAWKDSKALWQLEMRDLKKLWCTDAYKSCILSLPRYSSTLIYRIQYTCYQVKLHRRGWIHGRRVQPFHSFWQNCLPNWGCFSHLPESPHVSSRFIQMKKCVFRYAVTWWHEGRALCIGNNASSLVPPTRCCTLPAMYWPWCFNVFKRFRSSVTWSLR